MSKPKLLRGAKEIGHMIGVNQRALKNLILKHDLPAWKRAGCGPWLAIDDDLIDWMRAQRDLYISDNKRDALKEVHENRVNKKKAVF
jgi:hypothetical protein